MARPQRVELDRTYGEGVNLQMQPGSAWALYQDGGPIGGCGQGGRTTCPHTVMMVWENEECMRKAIERGIGRNKRQPIAHGVVDEWTSAGVFAIEVHG